MTLRAGVVVVHWRGMDNLRECLASLASAAGEGFPVVVAVNAGGDFDESMAREACPGVEIVRLDRNDGYAAGCNLGWRALGTRADVVLFLNNDVVVAEGFIEPLLRFFEKMPDAGIAGPPVVYYDDPSRVWALGGRIKRTFGYTRQIGMNGGVLPVAPMTVDYVNGSAIAVRCEVLEQLSGWDESYFHFFDEADLCERARQRGWRSILLPGVPVRHKVSATTGHRGSARFTRPQAYYFTRNRVRFFSRTGRGWRRAVALVMQVPNVLYECGKAVAGGRRDEARGRIEGLIDGVRGRSGERRGGW